MKRIRSTQQLEAELIIQELQRKIGKTSIFAMLPEVDIIIFYLPSKHSLKFHLQKFIKNC